MSPIWCWAQELGQPETWTRSAELRLRRDERPAWLPLRPHADRPAAGRDDREDLPPAALGHHLRVRRAGGVGALALPGLLEGGLPGGPEGLLAHPLDGDLEAAL